jgi:hypothetical protein
MRRDQCARTTHMNRRSFLVTGAAVALLGIGAYWAFRSSGAVAHERTVAFDNLYGNVSEVPIYVTVDDGLEQVLTATCDAKACTFKLPLTNGRHELAISVEQNGRRSAPAHVTVDTSNLR